MSLADTIGYVDKFHVKVGTENANAIVLVENLKKSIQEFKEFIDEEIHGSIEHHLLINKIEKVFGKELTSKSRRNK